MKEKTILAACCLLLLVAPAFATGQRQVQCLNGGCQAQAFVQPQVIYAQPQIVQQYAIQQQVVAVPYVQQQVVVQKQFVQKQRSRSSLFQRQIGGGRSSSLSIQRQRSR